MMIKWLRKKKATTPTDRMTLKHTVEFRLLSRYSFTGALVRDQSHGTPYAWYLQLILTAPHPSCVHSFITILCPVPFLLPLTLLGSFVKSYSVSFAFNFDNSGI